MTKKNIPHIKSGIYQILHVDSGKRYIGSSGDVRDRISSHKVNLRKNKHPNIALQRAFNKYGEDAFVFEKIFECSIDDLILHEQRLIDELNAHTSKGGYNIRIRADSSLGVRMMSRAFKAGDKYARLTFLEQVDGVGGRRKHHHWKLRCDCGNEIVASGNNVKRGITRSCGCYKKQRTAEAKRVDRTGEKYHRLTFVSPASIQKKRHCVLWDCVCDCGKHIIVPSSVVVNGNTKSCGCWNLENARNKMRSLVEDKIIKIRFCGKEMSMIDTTKLLGISPNALTYRVEKLGQTYEQACEYFAQRPPTYVFINGEKLSLIHATRKLGIGRGSIARKAKQLNWTNQQACDHFVNKKHS